MPYVETNHALIHYITLPDTPTVPQGMPLLTFVHGGGGSNLAFYPQIPFFAAKGYYVVSISVRGWGASRLLRDSAADCRACHFASDVLAVLDAVGAEQTAMVGHSIGGFYVMRMAVEAPERLTHAVMSSTFYGLVDEQPKDAETPSYITKYILHRQDERWTVCDELPASIKAALPKGAVGATHHSRGPDEGRPVYPQRPPNLSDAYHAAAPAAAFFYDRLRDANEQVQRLGLQRLFRVMHHEGAVTPAALRGAYLGPLLFTVTECDAMVHWECVCLVAHQVRTQRLMAARWLPEDANVRVHWFDGDLYHAPNFEDPEQYNAALLAFLRNEPLPQPPPGAAASTAGARSRPARRAPPVDTESLLPSHKRKSAARTGVLATNLRLPEWVLAALAGAVVPAAVAAAALLLHWERI